MKTTQKQNVRKGLTYIIQGMVVGAGGVLPGLSGGVMCVVFGIYQPLMEFLAHPLKTFKKFLPLILPLVIGVAIGFIGLSGLTGMLMEKSNTAVTCVFAGLVLGTLPNLWKQAGSQGRGKGSIVGLVASFLVFFGFLIMLKVSTPVSITPNVWWYLFCGIVWGLSVVVPGLSSSSLLIFLGLYQPLLTGVASLSLGVIIPFVAGGAVCVIGLSRLVNRAFDRHHSLLSHCIIGIVIATTLMIIPLDFSDWSAVLINALCMVLGIAAALAFDRWSVTKKAEEN